MIHEPSPLQAYTIITGVDEVGRGPLAGPVVAAAAVFSSSIEISQFVDSKSVSERQREALFPQILQLATDWAIVAIGPKTIDAVNIRNATNLAMKYAIENTQTVYALVDGNMMVETSIPHETIIQGDATVPCIGAASILAKVWRDKLMTHYDSFFPDFGFQKHKGYPSKAHREALHSVGPSIIHRYSFRTVSEILPAGPQALVCKDSDTYILNKASCDKKFGGDPFYFPELGEIWRGNCPELFEAPRISPT
ncbi:MAG: ribonuclease HII [Bdellovibrionales bacterium]|nr:ribonuclease HII [Bdellovibrionales bacterium]